MSIFFIAAQLTGGLLANSIAIMLDTAHLATDVLGFGIAIMAIKLAQKAAHHSMSFGYHRAEIIGTILSLAFLWGITIWLLFAAYDRLWAPPEIQENIMLVTAVAGLIFNIIQMTILGGHDHVHGHSHDGHDHGHGHGHSHGNKEPLLEGEKKSGSGNINLDGAMLHVLGDLLNSVGVIIAAVIIWFWPEAKIADPIVTFVFTLIIIGTSYPTLKKCLLTLMEATPSDVDYEKLKTAIRNCEGVTDVHDLHVWALTSGKNACSAHITSATPFRSLKKVEHEIKHHQKMGIKHITIQVEHPEKHDDHFTCKTTLH